MAEVHAKTLTPRGRRQEAGDRRGSAEAHCERPLALIMQLLTECKGLRANGNKSEQQCFSKNHPGDAASLIPAPRKGTRTAMLLDFLGIASKKQLLAIEQRVTRLELQAFLTARGLPVLADIDPKKERIRIETVELEDREQLEHDLGEVAREFRLPAGVTFRGDRGEWKRPSEEPKPPLKGAYHVSRGKGHRRRWEPERELPNCAKEFIIEMSINVFNHPQCAGVNWRSMFEEIRLRAVFEATRICAQVPLCERAHPTHVHSVGWLCIPWDALLVVEFGFECLGD